MTDQLKQALLVGLCTVPRYHKQHLAPQVTDWYSECFRRFVNIRALTAECTSHAGNTDAVNTTTSRSAVPLEQQSRQLLAWRGGEAAEVADPVQCPATCVTVLGEAAAHRHPWALPSLISRPGHQAYGIGQACRRCPAVHGAASSPAICPRCIC